MIRVLIEAHNSAGTVEVHLQDHYTANLDALAAKAVAQVKAALAAAARAR